MTMNHFVPDFEMEEEYSGLRRPMKSAMAEEDTMELLWQNGQVVVQNQNQKSSLQKSEALVSAGDLRSEVETPPHRFMQEEEMASWLHYPLEDSSFDRDLYADFLYPPPCVPVTDSASIVRTIDVRPPPPVSHRPPIPPPRRVGVEGSSRSQNFMNLWSPKESIESGTSCSNNTAKEMTVVDSNETPESTVCYVTDSKTKVSGGNIACGSMSGTAAAGTSSAAREAIITYELTVTSSPEGSGTSSAKPALTSWPQVTDDRKRKGSEPDDTDFQSEDIEFEYADAKKQVHGSTSTKRSRASEVHNLSERKRRDKINEKMRALQELIPRCNKSDKASMLDEAIEYLKSLQLQVQMMSMGCNMVPVMFPGVQQYMPPMGMGMGMGMGMAMGMNMGMNRPIVPFPSVLPGSALPTPAMAAQWGPRFRFPAFHMPAVPVPDPSRIQATNQSDPMLNSPVSQNPNQPQLSNFSNPYQHYLSLHQTQVPLPQNETVVQPNTSKPSNRRGIGHSENHQPELAGSEQVPTMI